MGVNRSPKRTSRRSRVERSFSEITQENLLEAAKPLLKLLNDGCNPHCKVIVTQTTVELVEGVVGNGTKEFRRD
jgi:hypothetical protein